MKQFHIPVGTSNFFEIRTENYYYVDKSGLIEELLNARGTKVTLITRPRRFGKTLSMSMLSEFFDIRKDSKELFENLSVSRNTELCKRWINQYPTLFLTFRSVDGLSFEDAYSMLCAVIARAYQEHLYLMDSPEINPYDRKIFDQIASQKATQEQIKNSLLTLTRLMSAYYQKPVILLIDEYDVPLAKASNKSYYPQMLDTVKGLLQVIKDNPSLHFAVITGCLQIAKESIFTGTNNFVSDTITDTRLNEYFGFTQEEVDRFLSDTDLREHGPEMKEWYDGYHFGEVDVYCPWDVVNHIKNLLADPSTPPAGYWKNSSDNSIIRSFIDHTGSSITKKFETLLSGGSILQKVEPNLTYDYLHSSEENLWSILYLTGYLTHLRNPEDKKRLPGAPLALVIPNLEIQEIFASAIKSWFEDTARCLDRSRLFSAVWNGDSRTVTAEMTSLLRRTISYHDYKEDFYHAFFAGIFAGAGYQVESNREHGEGRSDITVQDYAGDRVAVFEIKYSKTENALPADCERALKQIDERRYSEEFRDDYAQVICYGISFYKKRCLVLRKGETASHSSL